MIGHWNPGGLNKLRQKQLVEMFHQCPNLRVLAVSETHFYRNRRNMTHFELRHNLQIISLLRPQENPTANKRVGGGLALVTRPGVQVEILNRQKEGGISCKVSVKGFAPFSLIFCYIPPTGSKRVGWRAPLFDFIRLEGESARALAWVSLMHSKSTCC